MKAYHFQAEDQRRTGCGRVGASYHTHILSDVDCAVCRRSVLYKLTRRRSQCGATYAGLVCVRTKGHEGNHQTELMDGRDVYAWLEGKTPEDIHEEVFGKRDGKIRKVYEL